MRTSLKKELKNMSIDELKVRAEDIRREIFGLKMKKMSSPVKDINLVRNLRKSLACTLTFLQQGVVSGK